MSMWRTGIVTLVCLATTLMICPPASAGERWLSLGQTTTEENPKINLILSNDTETLIKVDLGGLLVNEVYENGEKFHALRLPEYYTTSEVGKPELPLISKLIGIPASADVEVEIIDSTVTVLRDFRIYPFQIPAHGSQPRAEFEIDEALYSRNEFYPGKAAWADDPAIWRDIRVASLRVCPVQFNPVTGELRIYSEITVRLKYAGTSEKNILEPRVRPARPEYDRMYRNAVLNYDYLNVPVGRSSKLDYDLLIITVDEFFDDLEPFTDWKNSIGVRTREVRLSDITVKAGKDETVDAIRDYIADEYVSSDIRFVLLVGDIDELPTHTYHADIGCLSYHVSDYYYALLDGGNNYLPEIAVGRFSTTSDLELANMINKTMEYTGSLEAWKRDVLVVVNQELSPLNFWDGAEEITEAVYSDPVDFDICYGRDGCDNDDVITRIEEGRGIVLYRGHGTVDCWKNWILGFILESFCKGEVDDLDNTGKAPIIFGISCLTNRLDAVNACLGEAFTRDNDGAVAYLGFTNESFHPQNNVLSKNLFTELFDNANYYLGDAIGAAVTNMVNDCEYWGAMDARMALLLGDPSLYYCGPPFPNFTSILYDTSETAEPSRPIMDPWLLERLRWMTMGMADYMSLKPFPFGPSDPEPYVPWTQDTTPIMQAMSWFGNFGTPHLADAICYTVDYLDSSLSDTADKRILLVTCGHEDTSSIGQCAGLMDPVYDPDTSWCDDQSSWTCMVWNKVTSSDIVLQVGYFGDGTDKEFLRDLAVASGGGFYDPSDTALCGNGVLEIGEGCEQDEHCALYGEETFYYGYCVDCECICSCHPGDADDDAVHNLLDVTYIINYLYKNGSEPVPYSTCSADPNCDCTVNLLDVTFMINYLYKEGPIPCDCDDWLEGCALQQ